MWNYLFIIIGRTMVLRGNAQSKRFTTNNKIYFGNSARIDGQRVLKIQNVWLLSDKSFLVFKSFVPESSFVVVVVQHKLSRSRRQIKWKSFVWTKRVQCPYGRWTWSHSMEILFDNRVSFSFWFDWKLWQRSSSYGGRTCTDSSSATNLHLSRVHLDP